MNKKKKQKHKLVKGSLKSTSLSQTLQWYTLTVMAKKTANKCIINLHEYYPVLKNRLKDTHGVSNWSLQGSVLFLLAADVVESKKQMVVIG